MSIKVSDPMPFPSVCGYKSSDTLSYTDALNNAIRFGLQAMAIRLADKQILPESTDRVEIVETLLDCVLSTLVLLNIVDAKVEDRESEDMVIVIPGAFLDMAENSIYVELGRLMLMDQVEGVLGMPIPLDVKLNLPISIEEIMAKRQMEMQAKPTEGGKA